MSGKMSKKNLIIIVSSALIGIILLVVLALVIIGIKKRDNGTDETDSGIMPPAVFDSETEDGDYPDELTAAPTALGSLIIEPLHFTEYGVAKNAAFLISAQDETLTAEHLREYISVRSGEAFTLEEQQDKTFLLTFTRELENDKVYNIVYHPPRHSPASYAFQTADIFRITATTPAHNTYGIPIDTGIEVTFNQPLLNGTAGFEAAFSIEPYVPGRFTQRDNTYIFVPSTLAYNTSYTVSVSQTVTSVLGDVLADEYIFSFAASWGDNHTPSYAVSGDMYETFLPWDEVFIELNFAHNFDARNFIVNIYDLGTPQNYVNFTGAEQGTLFAEFALTAQIFETEYNNQYFYLFIERTLPEGYYAAEIYSATEYNAPVIYKLIQVSPLSVYSFSTDGETVFWVHDAASGEPAQGASVSISGTAARVNADGVAIAQTRLNRRAEVLIQYGDNKPFVYTTPTYNAMTPFASDRFLSYMYTDRTTYRPNDTVDIFGVIMPRYGHSHSPNDIITLSIDDIIEMPVALDMYNSFDVRVPVTNMFGFRSIAVYVNGERLMSAYVNFSDYTNLAYVLSGGTDRAAYEIGDNIRYEISVTNFAGQPRENVSLHTSSNTNIRTNAGGIAAGSQIVMEGYNTHWQPYNAGLYASVAGDAQSSQSIALPYIVVPRNIMLEYELNGGTVSVTTNEISARRINEYFADGNAAYDSWGYYALDSGIYRGAPTNTDFEILVTRHTTTRTVRSETYDHINRRTVTTYDFNTTDEHFRTIYGRTENGRAVITDLPVSADPMVRYTMEIRYRDTNNRETTVNVYDTWYNQHNDSTIRYFSFIVESHLLGVNESTLVSVGEGALYWGDSGNATPLTGGQMLAVLERDGIVSANVGSAAGTPVTFTEACINEARLSGAYFDGRYIYPINHQTHLYYDFDERELEMDLSFDRERYRPGEDVTITVRTSRPSQVLISIVDESAVERGYTPNFLTRLYRSSYIRSWNISQFASHTQHNFGGRDIYAAEGGEGGDEDNSRFRDTFIDNPTFELVRTNANGTATVTMTLPDQITSWRVTALGITQDGFAGDVIEHTVSSLDFYVDLVHTNEYIVGDDIAAVARTYGANGGTVNYAFNILQDGIVIYTESQNTASSRVIFNAGKLPAGEYAIQVTASSNGKTDAVELPFSVAQSGLIIPNRAVGMFDTSDAPPLSPDYFNMRNLPVSVTFTNANIRPLSVLLRNAANDRSFRTDNIAAAAFADYFYTGEHDVSDVQSRIHARNGGVPELLYEEADFFYTARFAACFPEYVNHRRVTDYFQTELANEDTPLRRSAALLALAAMGEPVLLQIRDEAAQAGSEEILVSLYLAAALAVIGDDAGAMELIQQITVPADISDTAREMVNTLLFFINTTVDPGAALRHATRESANIYVSEVPEQIYFFRGVQLHNGFISEFQYQHNGITHTARLKNFERLHLRLSYEQYEALNITPIRGETEYKLDFYSYDASNWDESENRVGITRAITREGDLYRVDFSVTLPVRGSYTIYDRLPSNMRYIPLSNRNSRPYFSVYNTQRQLMELRFFIGRDDPLTINVFYHAMELYEADMEPGVTYIGHNDPLITVWGSTR